MNAQPLRAQKIANMHRDNYPVWSKLPRLLGTIDALQDRVAMLEAQLQEARGAAAEPTTRRIPD